MLECHDMTHHWVVEWFLWASYWRDRQSRTSNIIKFPFLHRCDSISVENLSICMGIEMIHKMIHRILSKHIVGSFLSFHCLAYLSLHLCTSAEFGLLDLFPIWNLTPSFKRENHNFKLRNNNKFQFVFTFFKFSIRERFLDNFFSSLRILNNYKNCRNQVQ